jgi:hypothetical protein
MVMMSAQNSQGDEVQFEQIVREVFSGPPRPARSIVLQMTEDSLAEFGSNESPDQEFFLDLAAAGVQIICGTRRLELVNEEQFSLLQKYMNSVGVELVVSIVNSDGSTSRPWEGEVMEGAKLSMAVRWL